MFHFLRELDSGSVNEMLLLLLEEDELLFEGVNLFPEHFEDSFDDEVGLGFELGDFGFVLDVLVFGDEEGLEDGVVLLLQELDLAFGLCYSDSLAISDAYDFTLNLF